MDKDTDLQGSIDSTRETLNNVLKELERVQQASKTFKIFTAVLFVLIICMGAIGYFSWDNARDSRDSIANTLETALFNGCSNNQKDRVQLRGVFQMLFAQAAALSENPEEVKKFADQFNSQLMEAVPDRDCAEEAEARGKAAE